MPRRGRSSSKRKLDSEQHKEEEEEEEHQCGDSEEEEKEEEKQSNKKTKLNASSSDAASEVTCPLCFWSTSTKSDIEFRVLAGCCDRMSCMDCLLKMMTGDAGKREIQCPYCREDHSLYLMDKTGVMTDQQLIKKGSTLFSPTFVERNGISIAPTVEKCSTDSCPKRAAYYCDTGCGDLCDTHHHQRHPPISAAAANAKMGPSRHKSMLIDEKVAFLQNRERRRLELEAILNLRKPKIEAATKEIEELKSMATESYTRGGECGRAVYARLDQLKKQDADWDAIIALGMRRKQSNAKERQEITSQDQMLRLEDGYNNELEKQLDAKSKQLASLLVVPLDAAKHVTDAEFDQYRDTSGLKKKVADLSERQKILMARAQLSVAPDLTSKFIKYLNQCSLLPVNGSKSRRELQRFLPAGISLDNASLSYKMSRDGSQAVDFYRLCCNRDQGRLLMLIKSAEYENVFGVLINVPLPQPGNNQLTVSDRSAQSCVFSLANRYHTPFNLRLKESHKHQAFQFTNVGNFNVGAEVKVDGRINKSSTLTLFSGGRPADIKGANFADLHLIDNDDSAAYELDESSFHENNPKPVGFQGDYHVLAGSPHFAATEIEVYLI